MTPTTRLTGVFDSLAATSANSVTSVLPLGDSAPTPDECLPANTRAT